MGVVAHMVGIKTDRETKYFTDLSEKCKSRCEKLKRK